MTTDYVFRPSSLGMPRQSSMAQQLVSRAKPFPIATSPSHPSPSQIFHAVLAPVS
jgi:hypothetical protein